MLGDSLKTPCRFPKASPRIPLWLPKGSDDDDKDDTDDNAYDGDDDVLGGVPRDSLTTPYRFLPKDSSMVP